MKYQTTNGQEEDVERQTVVLFSSLKSSVERLVVPGRNMITIGNCTIFLRTVSMNMSDIDKFIKMSTAWRNAQSGGFFSEFLATQQRTRVWLQKEIEGNPKRILFVIENQEHTFFGHLGLTFHSMENAFEVEDILRGEEECKGCMTLALSALCNWVFYLFPVQYIFIRSFVDNFRAIELYRRCGFVEVNRWPAFRQKKGEDIVWLPINPPPLGVPQRLVVKMIRSR